MKKETKKALIVLAAVCVFGYVAGFLTSKGIYDRPLDESAKSDTVWLTDTIPDYNPTPQDSVRTKWLTRWLPSAPTHDTITSVEYVTLHDSVQVAVPITQKHYRALEYDAYVSGYEPNLDSIIVYQKTQIITNTITKVKQPGKWEFDIVGGVDYGFDSKQWQPYAGGELTLNRHKRLQLGIEGGVKKNEVTEKFEPYAGAKVKVKVF